MDISFEQRATLLKTASGRKKTIAAEQQRVLAQGEEGSKEQYWKKNVRSEEDVVKFYSIYYPHYPEQLCRAIALRMTELKNGDIHNLPEAKQRKLLRKYDNELPPESKEVWDLDAEIAQQKMIGLVNVAAKNMDKLLADEK